MNKIHTDQPRRRSMNANVITVYLFMLIRHWMYARKYVIIHHVAQATGILGCEEQCLLHVDCLGISMYYVPTLRCMLHLEARTHPGRDGIKLFTYRSYFQMTLTEPCRSTVCDEYRRCLTDRHGRPRCVTYGVTGCLPPRFDNVHYIFGTTRGTTTMACQIISVGLVFIARPTIHTMTCNGGHWSKDVRACKFVRAVDIQEMKTPQFGALLPLPFEIDRTIILEGQQITKFQFGFSLLVMNDTILYFNPRSKVQDKNGKLHDEVLLLHKIQGHNMTSVTYKDNPFIFMGQFVLKVVHDEDRYTVSSGKFNWTLRAVTGLPPMQIFMFGVNMTSIVTY